MRLVKKLDVFILRAYLQLFAGAFFICLLVFLMQFVWRYLDELVGKGLTWAVLAKFVWYSSLSLVPISLPLAVLLASLVTFGNLGERLELLSMKAAGVPLVRILQPVLLFSLLVCGGSFYFQNKVGPDATKELARLLWSMRQKSPELEIPEGVFYGEIPGYNLYVERKDTETGMLYGVMIYSNANGYEDAEIVLADSARLQSTADKTHLRLTLHGGERFRNMDTQSGSMLRASVPYMRESFIREVDIISFDANFNLMDASLFAGNAQTKNLAEISAGIDSLSHAADSAGHAIWRNTMEYHMRQEFTPGRADSAALARRAAGQPPLDTLYAGLSVEQKTAAWRGALDKASSMRAECDFRAQTQTADTNNMLRRHHIERHKKFTLSLACLLFFFVGAPLGAIIRKGGLGMPVVISVVIFIFYYIINVGGENNAKTGAWSVVSGIWVSTAVLLPLGLALTYKANSDSTVFHAEKYRAMLLRLLGLRERRSLARKEVVIHPPRYAAVSEALGQLSADCREYSRRKRLRSVPDYRRLFFRYNEDSHIRRLSERLEELIEELHNSRDNVILARINDYPVLATEAHTRPFHSARLNRAAGLLLPLGLALYLRIWRYRLRLWADMERIQKVNTQIIERISKQGYE